MKTAIGVLLAGGKGDRLRSVTRDKILLRIGAGAVISWSAKAFQASGLFRELIVVYRDAKQREAIAEEFQQRIPDLVPVRWVQGGERRQDSVLNALLEIDDPEATVFIHDGARPFLTPGDLRRLLAAVVSTGAAAIATPVTDTIKRADRAGSLENLHLEDLNRSRLYAMATPQVLATVTLLHAKGMNVTDCVAAYSVNGKPVTLVEPLQNNLKITRPEDVELANFLIHTGSIQKVFELAYT